MISKKYEFQAFAFVMSFIMSGIISIVMLLPEMGANWSMVNAWFVAWAKSLIVAFPSSLVIVPLTKHFISRMVKQEY